MDFNVLTADDLKKRQLLMDGSMRRSVVKIRSKHITGSKEICLLKQNKTCKFSGQNFCQTTKRLLNNNNNNKEKEKKRDKNEMES